MTIQEDSLQTPSGIFSSMDHNKTPSPLQSKVTRPLENEHESPQMINFDFDTLDHKDYQGNSKLGENNFIAQNSASSPTYNIHKAGPKLNFPSHSGISESENAHVPKKDLKKNPTQKSVKK